MEIKQASSIEDPTAPYLSDAELTHRQIMPILIGICVIIFLPSFEQTVIGPLLVDVAQIYSRNILPWISAAYFLGMTVSTPLYGKLADIHGRRVIILVATALFTIGSLMCALAYEGWQFGLARFVQGVGGGGMLALSHIIVADIVAPTKRARYMVVTGSVVVVAMVAGPIVATALAGSASWRLIFWINVPLGLLTIIWSGRVLARLPRRERWHQLDWLGAVLITAAATSLLIAIIWMKLDAGVSRRSGVATVVAIGALLAFARQINRASEPFIEPELLTNRMIFPALLAGSMAMASLSGLLFAGPTNIAFQFNILLSETGWAITPLAMGTALGGIAGARLAARMPRYKHVAATGAAAGAVLLLTLAMVPSRYLSLVLVGSTLGLVSLSIGLVLITVTLSIQNAIDASRFGVATAAMTFSRSLASAVFVGLLGAMMTRETNPDVLYLLAALLMFGSSLLLFTLDQQPLRSKVYLAHDGSST